MTRALRTRRPKPQTPTEFTAAFAWGDNPRGGFGSAAAASSDVPVPVRLPGQLASLAVGAEFAVGLTRPGAVWAWGANTHGQLGDGTSTHRLRPVAVALPSGTRVVAVAAGPFHALALSADGDVFAWGANDYGQLGDGTTTDRPTPVRVAVIERVSAVAAGYDHSLAVTRTGAVYGWGRNQLGQVGDGTTSLRLTPVAVALPRGVRAAAAAAGRNASAVVTSAGAVYVWGSSVVAGFGAVRGQMPVPVPAKAPTLGRSPFIALAMGDRHALVLARDGTVQTWGRNHHGQLGDGTTTDRTEPAAVSVPGRARATAVATAGDHVLALTAKGDVVTWGTSRLGEAGRRDQAVTTPTVVAGLQRAAIRTIACGTYSSVVLADHGAPVALTLDPPTARTFTGQPFSFRIGAQDAFGNALPRPLGWLRLDAPGTHSIGATIWADQPGRYVVTATIGSLAGRAVLTVVDRPRPPKPPKGPR